MRMVRTMGRRSLARRFIVIGVVERPATSSSASSSIFSRAQQLQLPHAREGASLHRGGLEGLDRQVGAEGLHLLGGSTRAESRCCSRTRTARSGTRR